MNVTNSGGTSVAKRSAQDGARFGVATFVLVGAVSTVTQFVAIASQGGAVPLEWSTGGAVALVAGLWFWIRCRSWAAWRKWVWIPVIITVIVAFVTVNLQVAAARDSAAAEAAAAHAATCDAAETELTSMQSAQEDLLDRAWDAVNLPGERAENWRPRYAPAPLPAKTPGDWRDILNEVAQQRTGYEITAWELYTSGNGPALETAIAEKAATFAQACPSR